MTPAAEMFHTKVKKSIEMLNQCFALMSERACVYNLAKPRLPVSVTTISIPLQNDSLLLFSMEKIATKNKSKKKKVKI